MGEKLPLVAIMAVFQLELYSNDILLGVKNPSLFLSFFGAIIPKGNTTQRLSSFCTSLRVYYKVYVINCLIPLKIESTSIGGFIYGDGKRLYLRIEISSA